ncbi:MAG: response regulator [Betaproteobacteria bacterium]
MPRLLLVDDEPNILKALTRMCWNEKLVPVLPDLKITAFESPFEAIEFATHYPIDLVISDFRMPAMNGVALLSRIRALQPDAARIIVSAFADKEGIISAINDAAIFRFVTKPWIDQELKTAIGAALDHRARAIETSLLADETRLKRGALTAHEAALRRLEIESPGITKVRWDADGGVLLDA